MQYMKILIYNQPYNRQADTATQSAVTCQVVRQSALSVKVRALSDGNQLLVSDSSGGKESKRTRMWANAQRDGRPAKHRWRPLVNAAKFS